MKAIKGPANLTPDGRAILQLMDGKTGCKIVVHEALVPRLCGMRLDEKGALQKVDRRLEQPFVDHLISGGWIEHEDKRGPTYVLSTKGRVAIKNGSKGASDV